MANRHNNAFSDAHPIYREHIDKLIRAFPQVFNKDYPQILPIGIHNSLINYVDIDEKELQKVLYIWTRRAEYKARLSCGGMRYDMNGCAVSTISSWEVENAVSWVLRFRKKETVEAAQMILDNHLTEAGYEIWCKKIGTKTTPFTIH